MSSSDDLVFEYLQEAHVSSHVQEQPSPESATTTQELERDDGQDKCKSATDAIGAYTDYVDELVESRGLNSNEKMQLLNRAMKIYEAKTIINVSHTELDEQLGTSLTDELSSLLLPSDDEDDEDDDNNNDTHSNDNRSKDNASQLSQPGTSDPFACTPIPRPFSLEIRQGKDAAWLCRCLIAAFKMNLQRKLMKKSKKGIHKKSAGVCSMPQRGARLRPTSACSNRDNASPLRRSAGFGGGVVNP